VGTKLGKINSIEVA